MYIYIYTQHGPLWYLHRQHKTLAAAPPLLLRKVPYCRVNLGGGAV